MRIAHPGETSISPEHTKKPTRTTTVLSQQLPWLMRSMSLSDQVLFAENLAAMLDVGLSLYEALGILREESKQASTSAMIGELQSLLQSGQSLSVGMSRYSRVFSPIVVSAIRVGESSGTLAPTLHRVALSLQKEVELKEKVVNALWYPAMVLILMVIVAIVVMDMVMPNLMALFQSSGVALPWQTQALLWVYSTVSTHGKFWFFGISSLLIAGWALLRVPFVRMIVGRAVLHIPIVGTLISQLALLRFAQNFRTLLGSGLPMIEAFQLLVETTHAVVLKSILQRAQGDIERGVPVYRSLDRNARVFPPMAIRMIAVGERSGMLESILEKIVVFYERKTDRSFQLLTALLSPLLTIIIGLGVGFIAFSVIGPIYQLISQY